MIKIRPEELLQSDGKQFEHCHISITYGVESEFIMLDAVVRNVPSNITSAPVKPCHVHILSKQRNVSEIITRGDKFIFWGEHFEPAVYEFHSFHALGVRGRLIGTEEYHILSMGKCSNIIRATTDPRLDLTLLTEDDVMKFSSKEDCLLEVATYEEDGEVKYFFGETGNDYESIIISNYIKNR